MYGSEHRCEVTRSDLDGVRWELERTIEEMRREVHRLEERLDCLRSDLNALAGDA